MHDLNPQQKEALTYTEGPLLVFAGAGSGKTKVLTQKFSYLAKSKKFPDDSILTFAFTNRASEEMKQRVNSLLGRNTSSFWIGTFHSLCNRILRKDIKHIGYRNNFSIYDEEDQCNLVRHILREFKIYEALYKGIVSRISLLKASLVSPEEFLSSGDGFGFDEKLAKVYVRYQDELTRSNALDYDDLITMTIKLFENNPKLLHKYQKKFAYILVDDFQDTNYAQYHLLQLLAASHKMICVVADDDQSIYKYKGANASNLLNFRKDFPEAKLICLEQNYRSTRNILNVSCAVIAQNAMRKTKKLWTDKDGGEKVRYCWLNTYEDEARYIAKVIKELYLKGVYNYRDFAIFYRVSLQSRMFEEALRQENIPYLVSGNMSFYQRKEIKDMISYMRLTVNYGDNVSFRRVINNPPRGISGAALSKIEHEAKKKSLSLFETLKAALRSDSFSSSVREKLAKFMKLIETFSSAKFKFAADMLKEMLEKTGYAEMLDEERMKSVEELISSAEGMDVKNFLDRVSLFTNVNETDVGDYVSMMTLHHAKGLEFPVVFITGLEEGILPFCKAIENDEEVAEERRLFYVGMMRAKEMLWLTGASKRKLYTKMQEQEPSRFLKDIPRDCCHWIEKITGKHSLKLVPIKKSVKPRESITLYTTGCRVKHPSWGVGIVRDCYGEGDDLKIMVNFPNIGVKRLAVRFANLEKI